MDGQTLLWISVAGCLGGGLVGVVFAAIAWRNRDVPAAMPYGALALAVSAWGFFYAALLTTDSVSAATWVSQFTRATTAFVPVLWFRFTTTYTGSDQFRTRGVMTTLWVITIGYALWNITAPFHGQMVHQVTFETVAGLTAPVDPQGPFFWLFIGYAYLVITVGFGLLLRFLLRSRNIYRKQTAAIVAGSTLPLVGNVVVLLDLVPHPALDVTPMLFAVNGLVIGWALFQYDFLEVTPVATDRLVDELPDPVLVVDESGTVVEFNAAADRAVPFDPLGGASFDRLPLPSASTIASTQRVTLSGDDGERVYTPQVSTIEDQHGQQRGRLIVLRDVTVEQRRLDRIQALQSMTQRFLAATSATEISTIAVEFFEDDMDIDRVIWYRATDRQLLPAVESDAVRDSDDQTPTFDATSTLWDRLEAGEPTVVDRTAIDLDTVFATEAVLLVPVEDNGVFCLGVPPAADTAEYEQIATILRGTMVAALARVEREVQLRKSRREIDQRTEQIEFFSGVLRHNIRNGMQVIQSHTDVLENHVDGEGGRLEVIEDWSEELIELTREVRRITDAVTAPESERRRSVELGPVLTERVDALATDFDVDISSPVGAVPPVYANDLVGKVLDSVLHNAVEHTDSEHPRIDVSVRGTSDFVEVRIADRGPGISDELRESVFEREVATRQTAHGFGLYFVSVMMDLYEGDVWFEDNEPQGTVAVLQFERADAN